MENTKRTLEDYIFDMQTRPPEELATHLISISSGNLHRHQYKDNIKQHQNMADHQDVWTQLRKKEEDLLLAAELGKALLEKNEEITKQHERIIDEFSTKLEVSF